MGDGPTAPRLIREGSRLRATWDLLAVAAVVATAVAIPFRLNIQTTFRVGGVEILDRGAVAGKSDKLADLVSEGCIL